MSPQELNRLLTAKIEQVLHHIFPENGKMRNGLFTIGNIAGDAGNSLLVYTKDGRFKDTATEEHGDMLELFSLKYGSKAAGIEAAYNFLGIKPEVATGRLSLCCAAADERRGARCAVRTPKARLRSPGTAARRSLRVRVPSCRCERSLCSARSTGCFGQSSS